MLFTEWKEKGQPEEVRTTGVIPGQLCGGQDRLRTPQIQPGAPFSLDCSTRFSVVPGDAPSSPAWLENLPLQDGSSCALPFRGFISNSHLRYGLFLP